MYFDSVFLATKLQFRPKFTNPTSAGWRTALSMRAGHFLSPPCTRMRQLQQKVALSPTSIRQMIEEGRRF
jgi:hypothetical protein